MTKNDKIIWNKVMLLGKRNRGMKISEFRRIRRPLTVGVYSLFILIGIGFLLPFARTQSSVEALIDLTGEASITMTSIKNSATVTIDPSATGVFETTSGEGDIAFSVSTTNYTGYTLSARSTVTTLNKETSSIASLTSGVTAEQFALGGNTTLSNRWGYKPSFYNSEANSYYFGSSTSAVTLDHTVAANSTAKDYTISLGARVDNTLPSGSYINDNFILETVANVVPTSILTISYGDHVTGVTIGGTSVTSGETVKLIVGAPYSISMTTDQHFDRASWTATTGTIASASSLSTTYTITSSNATLTATGLFNGPEIQNLSDANCTSTASLAIDTRDETIYQVKRLEDGRCWMMQNLDLGRTALSADLTSSNTNISSTISFSTFNNWVKAAGTWTYSGGEVIPVTGTDSVSDVPYGTLYNYYAVSAGTIAGYTNANNAVYDICPAGWRLPTGGTSGEFAAIYAYHDSYNDFRASEADGGLAYPLSGAFVQSGPESVDTAGIFWASTISTGSNWARGKYDISMQELFITEAIEEPIVIEEPSVFLGDADYRTLGIAARCIKKNPSHTLTINYGSGVQAVYVNGNLIANSGQISIEEGVPHPIKVIFDKNFAFSSWSATSGTIGTASEQFTTYAIGSSNATLTANGAVFTGGVIQNLDSSLCTTTEAKFKDNRDNQVYTVKRLADGRCWMMQNLDLGRTSLTVDLTSANSNLETTVPAATFNSWVTSSSPAATYDSGVVVSVSGMSLESDIPKGTYYNFYAASGGTISGSTNASNSTHDICPAGWRLPTGGANSEMRIMSDLYSEDLMIRTPSAMGGAAFGITGNFGTNGTISQDGYGEYWTSTRSSNTNMRYLMTFGSGYGYNDNSTLNRRNGASIRCILDQMIISDLQYLQDFASLTNQERSEVASSMLEGQTYQLTDNRDSKVYDIAKMKDGRIWLAENLDLGRTTLSNDLTSANTNLGNTIPYATFNGWKKSIGTMTYANGEFINVTGTDEASGTAYGTLYNYYAATAGTIKGSESGEDAHFDICPAGWRLPIGGSSGEFQTLYTQYPSNARMRAPITEAGAAFTLAGVFYGGAPTYQETNGRLWSSTRVDSSNVNINFMSTTGVSPASTNGRRDGCSIRCIVKTNVYTLTASYGTGVSSIEVNGITVQNGSTITLEPGLSNTITMTPAPGYSFTSWSATSGTVGGTSTQSTTYIIGSTNATLTATATFTAPDIQNLDPADCTSTLSYAVDTRDNHLYAIKRLDDGSCWMMENLDLGRTTLTTDLTSSNTNLSTTITASTFNTWKTTAGTGADSDGEFINVTGTDSTSNTPYGTLYNYYVASAGTISGSTNSSKARYDICPAGWRLPTGGTGGEFDGLYAEYNSNALMRAPYTESGAAFALAGWFNDSGADLQEENGFYWASTRVDDAQMNVLYLSASSVGALSNSYRNSGRSIRCVLNEPMVIGDLTYMQDFAILSEEDLASVVNSMDNNTTYNLIDNRDNKTYKVAKLEDGNIWMAENLDLGRTTLTTDLTSSNTNLFTTVAASTFNGWKKTGGGPSYTDGEFISISGSDPVSDIDYGTLYNFHAASAGTVSGNANRNNAVYDICPAGWRLPVGTVNGEYQELYSSYNSVNSMRASISDSGAAFALAGDFLQGAPVRQGNDGFYWTSSNSYTDTGVSALAIHTSSVYPSSGVDRNLGASIRCIAKKPAHSVTITYAAGISNVTVNGISVPDGASINLEEGIQYAINAYLSSGYTFGMWSVSSGTILQSSAQSMIFTIGSADATITMTTTFTGPNIQNLTSSNCTSTPSNAKDTRDGHVYTIQRLADGNCWMMENLDLGRTTLTTDLTSSNTNISTTIPAATFNSWKKTSGSQTNSDGEFFNVDGIDSTSETAYGTLYNYYAATAGTISGNSNTNNSTYDICPSGWRLPTGGSYNGEFQNLYAEYNSLALMRAPVSQNGAAFALAGSFRTTPGNQGNWGSYWSSTTQTETSRYYLFINGTDVYPARYNYRYDGYAIRCILNEPKTISELEYMQDFNNLTEFDKASLLASMSYNTTYDLIDYRDNRTYKIAKMKDGNIWMAENLDLGKTNLTVSLTYANTNIEGMIPYGTFNGWITTSAVGTNGAGEVMAVAGTDATSGTAYGTLYNYYAASAGEVSGNSYSANANHDICPAGWRLPTGSIYGEVYNLYSISDYNSPTLFRTPITSGGAGFSLAGVAWSGAPEYTSYYASYWTSSMASDTLAFRASMNQSSVGADGSDNRSPLGSVRCIAKLSDKTITDYTKMQELRTLTSETKTKLLNSMAEKTNYTLVDARDSTSYTIAKLKDGNIWMTKNLDLGRTALSENLNSVNTNMSNPNIPYATFNGWKKTSGTATYDTGEFINVSGSDATSGTPYGTLYNFYAASAGTISGSSNSSNAEYDICPAGWRLPTGGSSGEFQALYTEYNTNALMRAPIANGGAAFALAGYFRGSAPTGQGSIGYYWSSARYNNAGMHTLNLDTSSVDPAYSSGNLNGLAIRCIVK